MLRRDLALGKGWPGILKCYQNSYIMYPPPSSMGVVCSPLQHHVVPCRVVPCCAVPSHAMRLSCHLKCFTTSWRHTSMYGYMCTCRTRTEIHRRTYIHHSKHTQSANTNDEHAQQTTNVTHHTLPLVQIRDLSIRVLPFCFVFVLFVWFCQPHRQTWISLV